MAINTYGYAGHISQIKVNVKMVTFWLKWTQSGFSQSLKYW